MVDFSRLAVSLEVIMVDDISKLAASFPNQSFEPEGGANVKGTS